MKLIKVIAIILFLSLFSTQLYSQFSVSGNASFLNLFGGSGLKNFGAGIKADYAPSDKQVFLVGFNYYFPSSYTVKTTGIALNSWTNPQQIDVDLEYSVKFSHLYLGIKRYFWGGYEEDFGIYGMAEAGLLIAPCTTKVGEYDYNMYYTVEEDGKKETLGNFTLNFGLGFEINVGAAYIFTDAKLNLPANRSGDVEVEVEIPASVSVSAGVRIPF